MVLPVVSFADDWPQWRGANRDGVWKETGLVETFPSDKLEHKWSVPIGPGYNGPTVADGRVYAMDRQTDPKEVERILCFDWETGKPLWTHTYDAAYQVDFDLGPRASVTIDDGLAYSLGTMGHFHCLDAETGKVVWSKDLLNEYKIDMPIWGISASPLVYEDLVIVHIGGVDGASIVAFDKKSGEEKWRALNEKVSYSSPIVIEQAGHPVLVCWTGESLSGLDPKTGKLYWSLPAKPTKMVINIATPITDGERLFVSCFYDGSIMAKLDQDKLAVEEVWRRRGINEKKTDSLHSIISTPYLKGDYVYGMDSYGEMRCLEAATGDRVWEDLTAVRNIRWGNIHFVENGDRMWMFNEEGDLLIGKLSPEGFTEIDRAKLLEPTSDRRYDGGGPVCWSHPAYAYKHIFARNDDVLVCASLAAD
jgi:outer membrane protein assembly factor BamB